MNPKSDFYLNIALTYNILSHSANKPFFEELSVSVIIPAYNSRKTIVKSLDSIINQTVAINEVLIIDDGSTDDTAELVSNYIDKHTSQNIKLLQQANSGPSSARNLGIKHAKSDLIAFLDSDDQWLPDKTREQIELFKTHGRELCLVGCLTLQSKKNNTNYNFITVDFKDLLWRNYFSTPTVMIWKELLLENSFNINQKYSEDYNLWLRVASKGKIILINKVLVVLDDKPVYGHTGLSSQIWKMECGELSNYLMLFNDGIIKRHQYYFFSAFSLMKFFMRCLISFKRRGFSFKNKPSA